MFAASTAIAALVLRDVHQPPAPPWWPPAPGWWMTALAVAALVAAVLAWRTHRRRRQRRISAWFDGTVDSAGTPALQVQAMSQLLRRAARCHQPGSELLQGAQWLSLLDGDDAGRPFSEGPGRLLLDGGYRPDTPAAGVAELRPLVRARFLAWMGAR